MNTDCIWGDLSTLIAAARRFGIDIVLVTSTAAGLMYARRYNAGGEEEEASSYAVYHNKNTLVMCSSGRIMDFWPVKVTETCP